MVSIQNKTASMKAWKEESDNLVRKRATAKSSPKGTS